MTSMSEPATASVVIGGVEVTLTASPPPGTVLRLEVFDGIDWNGVDYVGAQLVDDSDFVWAEQRRPL